MQYGKTVTDAYQTQLLKSLADSIRIPSIKTEAKEGAPFGMPIDQALRHVLACAEELGMRTFYGDGYYGYVEIGQGKELIGILCHVDVVPAGDLSQWKYPPFDGQYSEGHIWGRGVLDDKGPLFAVLYAMKRIVDCQPELNKRIRLIIGTDEETGWECIERYKKHEEIPDYGFSPDADFPVVHGEKGFMQIELRSPFTNTDYRITGGIASNSVPESCTYEGLSTDRLITVLEKADLRWSRNWNGVTVYGKAAHASMNWLGENAITNMCQVVAIVGKNPLVRFVAEKIGSDPYGTSLFGVYEDRESGYLTITPSILEIDETGGCLVLDIRTPVTKDCEEVVQILESSVIAFGLEMSVKRMASSLYVPTSNPLVIGLSEAYEVVCGEQRAPVTMGGATYARSFERFVAFGPLFPGEIDTAHGTNECMSLESLFRSMEIYYQALNKLAF